MNTSDTPRPKPAPPKPQAPAPAPAAKPAAVNEKPKFVRKPHLTERPFKSHEGLAALRKQMEKPTPSRARSQKEKK